MFIIIGRQATYLLWMYLLLLTKSFLT